MSASIEIGTCAPSAASGHEHALERVEVFAKIAGIADIDRIALAAFDRGGDGLAADGGFDDVVHVADAQAVARGGFAIDVKIEEITAGCALGENAAGVRESRRAPFRSARRVLGFARDRGRKL